MLDNIHMYKLAIIQSAILNWEVSQIQNLLRSKYNVLLRLDEIDAIITSSGNLINKYDNELRSGEAKFHRRLKLFAKENRLNSKLEYSVQPENSLLISRIVSIVTGFHKISHESIISIYREEFNNSDEIKYLLMNIDIYRYENSSNYFTRLNNTIDREEKIKEVQINNEFYKIIFTDSYPVHINESLREIYLKDTEFSIKFIHKLFEMKDLRSDSKINDFINEVLVRL